jgi:integrase
MFTHAVRWGYLRENPAHYVEKPKIPHREMAFLTKDEIHRLLASVCQDRYAFFLTAISTGMRLGELLAMKWSHVRLASGGVLCEGKPLQGEIYRAQIGQLQTIG